MVGQLAFGWGADKLGRKRIYGFEIIIMLFGVLAQALSAGSESLSFVGVFVFWRVVRFFPSRPYVYMF